MSHNLNFSHLAAVMTHHTASNLTYFSYFSSTTYHGPNSTMLESFTIFSLFRPPLSHPPLRLSACSLPHLAHLTLVSAESQLAIFCVLCRFRARLRTQACFRCNKTPLLSSPLPPQPLAICSCSFVILQHRTMSYHLDHLPRLYHISFARDVTLNMPQNQIPRSLLQVRRFGSAASHKSPNDC